MITVRRQAGFSLNAVHVHKVKGHISVLGAWRERTSSSFLAQSTCREDAAESDLTHEVRCWQVEIKPAGTTGMRRVRVRLCESVCACVRARVSHYMMRKV